MLNPIIINGMPCVTLDMVQAAHGKGSGFAGWMVGQTYAIINNVNIYYYYDYVRWFKGLPVID